MKRFEVLLTAAAERDLDGLHDHVSELDSPEKADRLLDRILALADDLSTTPERGPIPRELSALGIREYRQVLFGPYRVIYRVFDGRVIIYVIADGRRDFQSLLARRLLEG